MINSRLQKRLINLFILATIGGLYSCKKEIKSPPIINEEISYYPIAVGNEQIYEISHINIDAEIDVFDTTKYQLKERISELLDSNEYFLRYKLERFIKTKGSSKWVKKQQWQLLKYNNSIHRVEDNLELICLNKPLKKGTKWDRNLYNINKENIGTIKEINSKTIDGKIKKNIVVSYSDESNLVKKQIEKEEYTENIGLSERTYIDVELYIDPQLAWTEKIKKGELFYQKLIQ